MPTQTPFDNPMQPSLWSKLASDFHTYLMTYYLTPQTPTSHTQKIITNFSEPAITLWITSAIFLGFTISFPQLVPMTRCLDALLSNALVKRLAIAFFLIPGFLVAAHVLWMLDTIASIVIVLWIGELVPSTTGGVLQLCYYFTAIVAMGGEWCWFVGWMYSGSFRALIRAPASSAEVEDLRVRKLDGLNEKCE